MGFAFGGREETVFAFMAFRGDCWALMAPALRSSRRRWPLERWGVSLEREEQGVMERRGRVEMNVVGDGFGG